MHNPLAPERSLTPTGQISSLPPVDTGSRAWFFVAAAFAVETLLWGPVFSSGVFLKYYAAQAPFSSSSETKISLIGTLSLFFGYSVGLPLIYFYNRFPRYIKPSLWFGLGLYVCSMLGASFVKSVDLLIVLQGIGPGIAAALCAFPIIRWLPEWFDKRKGTAIGIIFSGGGVGGAFMPVLYQFLIDRVGLGWTLRISAISTGLIAGTAVIFVNPRVPISISRNVARSPMQPFIGTFWSVGFFGVFFTTLLQGFGYFNVGLFLPRFSDTLSTTESAGLLSAFNVSQVAAQMLWGYLTDRMSPVTAMSISSITGSILVLTLWGFGGGIGLPVFAPFAIAFGLAAGGFSSMWSQSAHAIAGPDKEKQTMLISGWSIARALGAVVGPTLGSVLYQAPSNSTSWGSAGSPGLVALVGASLACSAAIGILFARGPQVLKTFKIMCGGLPRSCHENEPVEQNAYELTDLGAVEPRNREAELGSYVKEGLSSK